MQSAYEEFVEIQKENQELKKIITHNKNKKEI